MGRVWGALLTCAAVLLAGCSGVAGEPSPADPTAAPTTVPTGLQLPPRPRDVRIDGVDPCSLLTETQRAELGFRDRAVSDVLTQRLYDGPVPSCLYEGQAPRPTSVGVGLVVSNGVERFAATDVDAEVRATAIGGFPAVVVVPRRYQDYCTVAIDVAAGQLVEVQYADVALPPPIPQDELCKGAERVGELLMRTLLRL